MTKRRRGVYMALLNGFFGATASCFGKFAFDPTSSSSSSVTRLQFINKIRLLWMNGTDTVCHIADESLIPIIKQQSPSWLSSCTVILQQLLPRSVCFVLMLLSNGIMLSTFLVALEDAGSLSGSAISSASNMSISALYGYLLFNDSTSSYQGWVGFSMILVGVALLSTVQVESSLDRQISSAKTPTDESRISRTIKSRKED